MVEIKALGRRVADSRERKGRDHNIADIKFLAITELTILKSILFCIVTAEAGPRR
jgi:hypothetical protein